jgi:mRNA interferase MazF
VLTRFPFSNQIKSNQINFKVRPVLVLSKDTYNRTYADVLVCAITSNLDDSEYGIQLTNDNLEDGHLKLASKIRVDALTTIEKDIIIKRIGLLKKDDFQTVLRKINTLFVEDER